MKNSNINLKIFLNTNLIFIFLCISILFFSSCNSNIPGNNSENKEITTKDIIFNLNKYINKSVVVSGYFFGWHLPSNCKNNPEMITRSDSLICSNTNKTKENYCLYFSSKAKVIYSQNNVSKWDYNSFGKIKLKAKVVLHNGKPVLN